MRGSPRDPARQTKPGRGCGSPASSQAESARDALICSIRRRERIPRQMANLPSRCQCRFHADLASVAKNPRQMSSIQSVGFRGIWHIPTSVSLRSRAIPTESLARFGTSFRDLLHTPRSPASEDGVEPYLLSTCEHAVVVDVDNFSGRFMPKIPGTTGQKVRPFASA